MELTKFCPKCGKETDELYGNERELCADCYSENYDLLDIPDTVELNVCSTCGRMRKKGEWIEEYTLQEQLGALFEQFAEEDVEMELQYWEEDDRMFVRVHAKMGEIEDFYDTELKIEKNQCETCSKFHGGFFKVKMQLRGDGDLDSIADRIADRAAEVTNEGRKHFLANIDRSSEGFDFYFSTEKIAGEILKMLKSRNDPEVKRSYELIGEEDGKEVYRNIISVRV